MKKAVKPLIKTNPYLRNLKVRERLIEKSVSSSCGVEGIKVDATKYPPIKITKRRDKKIYRKINYP